MSQLHPSETHWVFNKKIYNTCGEFVETKGRSVVASKIVVGRRDVDVRRDEILTSTSLHIDVKRNETERL